MTPNRESLASVRFKCILIFGMEFQWDWKNFEHIAEHGVTPAEAEYVVRHAQPPFPVETKGDKWLVWGATSEGRFLQVVFTHKSLKDVDYFSVSVDALAEMLEDDVPVIRVIHSMPMTPRMMKRYRKLTKRQ